MNSSPRKPLRNRLTALDANGDGDTTGPANAPYPADATYTYDPDGNRTKQQIVGQTAVYYLIDDNNPTGYSQTLEEKSSPTGSPTRTYVIGSDVIAQTNASTALRYFLYDGHGSTRALLTDQGTIYNNESYAYDAFGNPIAFTPSTALTLLYSGEQYDSGLKQYYLRARYYDQAIGRFSSFDSYMGDTYDPQSLHKYLYCSENPINGRDPSGHFGVADIGVSAGIGAGLGVLEAGAYSYANGDSWGGIAASMAVGLAVGGATGLALGFFAYAMTGALVSAGLSGGMAVAVTGGFFGTAGTAMSAWGFNAAYQRGDKIGMWFAGASLALSVAGMGLAIKGIMGELKSVPKDIQTALMEIISGAKRPNVRNPKPFTNDGRGGTVILPKTDARGNPITYTEYTVNPRPSCGSLDGNRIIRGSDGSTYYTTNHFVTVKEIR